jgi:hypothetical protein
MVTEKQKPAASFGWQRVFGIVFALVWFSSARATRSPARHRCGGDASIHDDGDLC